LSYTGDVPVAGQLHVANTHQMVGEPAVSQVCNNFDTKLLTSNIWPHLFVSFLFLDEGNVDLLASPNYIAAT